MTKGKTANTDITPQVYKEDEYSVFCGLVADGLWKNNKFLAEICGVDDETIGEWKKRDEVKSLRRKAVGETLKKWKRVADPEKQLKEQGMVIDPEKLDVSMEITVKGLEEL